MLNCLVPNEGEFVFYILSAMIFLIVFKNLWPLKLGNADSALSLFYRLFQSLMGWSVTELEPCVAIFISGTFREFSLALCRYWSVLSVKKVWNDFGEFLFIWSSTSCKLLRVAMSFNLKIFDSLYRAALDSHGRLKLIIQSALVWISSVLFMTWVWVCPYSWQSYRRWDSKIAEYIVFKSFKSKWYLILGKRIFPLLSLTFFVSMCCLNVRCWSSFKHKFFASLTIYIFCPLILKFVFWYLFFCSEEDYFCFTGI